MINRNPLQIPNAFDPWGLDNSVSDNSLGSLHMPWNDHAIGWIHAQIARYYGVKRAFISTNGTTTLNKLALYTLLNPGGKVLVERDCHISMIQTITEIGAIPVWLVPAFDLDLGINLASTPEAIEEHLDRDPDIQAVVLTSPKYFGVVGDIRGCVAACQAHGVPVLVDEAHGACLAFHPNLPDSATAAGADLVTQSTHKTTEAWSQGSVLLINNEALCRPFLDALHGTPAISTSFSFGIIASVQEAVDGLKFRGKRRLNAALLLAEELRQGANLIPGIRSWGAEQAGRPGFRELDPLRVTIDVSGLGLTGIAVESRLQRGADGLRPVVAELGDLRNVLFLVTFGNTHEDVATVLRHLRRLSARRSGQAPTAPAIPNGLPRQVMSPRDAFWAVMAGKTRRVPITEAIGRVSAETVAVYPPGNALLVQGEMVEAETVAYLHHVASLGAHLKGATDPAFNSMRIIE